MRRRLAVCPRLLLAIGLALPGCGAPKAGGGGSDHRAALEEVAEVYQHFRDSKKRAPTRLADLRPLSPIAPSGLPALENGDCIAVWGAGLSDAPGAGQAVLVYDKNVPQQGGYVLMQNGDVKKMTAQEFQAAPKAKK